MNEWKSVKIKGLYNGSIQKMIIGVRNIWQDYHI